MENFSERLKELRKEKALSQKSLAAQLSVTIPTLSHWECGYQEPSLGDLVRICLFFNVSTDYLLGRTDELGAVMLSQQPALPILNDNEKQLIALYRSMNEPQKIRFFAFGEGITSASDKKYMS